LNYIEKLPESVPETPRNRLIGLGSKSMRKTYFPSLKRFRNLLDQGADGIVLAELPEGKIVDMNNAASAFFTSSPSLLSLPGAPPSMEQFVKGELRSLRFSFRKSQPKTGRDSFFDFTGKKVFLGSRPYLVITIHDITEKEELRAQLEESLKEKEVLLKEVHHRVKNNLQIIISLLNLNAASHRSAASASLVNEMLGRIHAIALVHEQLYQSKQMHNINMNEYLTDLIHQLSGMLGSKSEIRIDMNIEEISSTIDRAVPLGLILNELITNSYKHAFKGLSKGKISLSLRRDKDNIVFSFSNDGHPFPSGFNPEDSAGLGMALISGLTKQIGGSLEFKGDRGAQFTITLSGN
jgi:two-component sensor histidine kinase